MIGRAAAGLAIAGLLLTGCAEKVSGQVDAGGAAPPGSPSGATSGNPSTPPSAPGPGSASTPSSSDGSSAGPPSGGSSTAPTAHLACPRVVDVAAHLAYYCVNGSMTPASSTLWPFKVQRSVDVHWTMDEGSGDVTKFAAGKATAAAAKAMVSRMVGELYGTPVPTTKTVQDVNVAVDKATGHLIQTLITLNPGYVKAQHLRVRQERLWVLVVPVASGELSGWYTSIPDVAKTSWPKVPSIIKGLQIVH
jgi:hypothetical protein